VKKEIVNIIINSTLVHKSKFLSSLLIFFCSPKVYILPVCVYYMEGIKQYVDNEILQMKETDRTIKYTKAELDLAKEVFRMQYKEKVLNGEIK
jgi:hypothetical protein